MWKRILGIGVVVLLVGGLIGGGVYILLRSGRDTASQAHSGRAWPGDAAEGIRGRPRNGGNLRSYGESQAAAGAGGFRGGSDFVLAQGIDLTSVPGAGARRGTWSQTESTRSRGEALNRASEPIGDQFSLTGTLVGLDEELVILTGDGEEMAFALGPSWFRESEGNAFRPGDTVRVTGYDREGIAKIGTVENLSTGQVLTLRNDAGQPLWGGRGRWAAQ